MKQRLALIALFAAVSIMTRAPLLGVPLLDLDEAAHVVGSWNLLRGGRLYTDFVDNKPPLLYGGYAFLQLLFGRGIAPVRLGVALLVLPFTAYAASAFYRHDRRGLVAGLLYLIYGAAFLAHDMHAAHAEVFFLLPLAWAVARLCEEHDARKADRLFAAGLLSGLACLIKPQAAAGFGALALAVISAGRRDGGWRFVLARLGSLGAGALLPLAATGLAFTLTGGAGDLIYWTLLWNLSYAANPITASEALLRAARGLLPFVLVTAPLWWLAFRSWKVLDGHRRRLVLALSVLLLPVALVGFRFYPHYFVPLYLPLALGAAPEVSRLLRSPLTRGGRLLVAYTAIVLVGFTVANVIVYRVRTDVYEETSPLYDRVAAVLRRDPAFAAGTLFVWGYAPGFYARLPDLRPASRFVMPQSTLTGYVAGNTAIARGEVDASGLIEPRHWDLLLGDLERNRATFILDTSPSGLHRWNHFPLRRFPRLEAYIRDRYDLVTNVDGVHVYRRR